MISLFDLYVPDATASAVDKPAATIPKAIPASAPATNKSKGTEEIKESVIGRFHRKKKKRLDMICIAD